ncbi:C-type lectin domain family 4 member G-like [Seriola lalandi dorsalis]|uniref:C-type lectin domain family 4 member G-like n=1 Tax=Seriola lalandi dorsalis TaxID=1841481 RepID=UPI000C6F649B|nr:C-type lectin domain family 4 member G-like [Seriola lalandi dorsalis]
MLKRIIMEEELNYVTVTFKEKPNDLEIIYDEVKTEQVWDKDPVIQESEKKAPLCTLLPLVAAGLGVVCVILVSVIIALTIHLKTVMSEHNRDNMTLTARNLLLTKKKTDLERQTDELTRERDGLNWTIRVILEHENFPVNTYCPQKVCRPCLDGWVPFQSSCYLFSKDKYSYYWNTWKESQASCKQTVADLVVIDSQEEQEFISNHTEEYHDEKHGYWIGLRKNEMDTWMWVDGSNVTVMYWTAQEPGPRMPCVLSLPREDPMSNWQTAGCSMKNRYICERRALIKAD